MSSHLTIEPAIRSKKELSLDLKFALKNNRYKNGIFNEVINISNITYFTGLLDAGIEDAQIVIEMLEKYGDCILHEEY